MQSTSRKIVLIGRAPTRGASSTEPLDGVVGRRLAALAGLDHKDFMTRFDRVNLVEERAPPAAMLEAADALRPKLKGRKVVLLGATVAAAFRLRENEYTWFKPVEIPPNIELAVMPHVDGKSTWWNEPANEHEARDFMLRLQLGYLVLARVVPKENQFGQGPGQGQPEKFTPAQVGIALIMGRGIYTWAAKCLAETTGIHVSGQAISDYVKRYPDLAEIQTAQKTRMLDVAENNVVKAVEAGDVETSRWLLRSKMAAGRGYELQVQNQVSGHISHDHVHAHAHVHKRAEDLTDDEAIAEWRRRTQARIPASN